MNDNDHIPGILDILAEDSKPIQEMTGLDDMLLPGRICSLLVNEPHVHAALAQVLGCSITDVDFLTPGETDFNTLNGVVTVVYFAPKHGDKWLGSEIIDAGLEVRRLPKRVYDEKKTILIVQGWDEDAGNHMRTLPSMSVFLSRRCVMIAKDGKSAINVREQAAKAIGWFDISL
jgi:hypothetical protein